MNISRKTILAVLGVIGALLVFFKDQFGLSMNSTAIVAALTTLVLYIFFEAKVDVMRIKEGIHQGGRFRDPKFWLALISAILAAINTNFGLGIPVEAVISVLTIVMSILFGLKLKTA